MDEINSLLDYMAKNIEKIDLDELDADMPKIDNGAIFDLSQSGAVFYQIQQKCLAISPQLDIMFRPSIIPIYNDALIRQKMGIGEECKRIAMTRKEVLFTAQNILDNCELIEKIYTASRNYTFPDEWQIIKYVPHNNFSDYYLYMDDQVVPHTLGSFKIIPKTGGKVNIHFAFALTAETKSLFLMLITYLNTIIGEYHFIHTIRHIKLKPWPTSDKLSLEGTDFRPLKEFPEALFAHTKDDESKCAMCFLRGYNCAIIKSDMTDDSYCDFCKRGVEKFLTNSY
jgi:hypothetical protein